MIAFLLPVHGIAIGLHAFSWHQYGTAIGSHGPPWQTCTVVALSWKPVKLYVVFTVFHEPAWAFMASPWVFMAGRPDGLVVTLDCCSVDFVRSNPTAVIL